MQKLFGKMKDAQTANQRLVNEIEEHKHTSEALRKSKENYRQLVNYAPAGICELDLVNQKLVSVNDIVVEYTGYSKDELYAMDPYELLNKESQMHSKARLEKILSGEKVPDIAEYKIKTKIGKELWVIWNISIKSDKRIPTKATAVIHDITERKMAIEALLRSKEEYRLLVEEINDIIFRTDQNGNITFISPVIKKLGYTPSDLLGRNFSEFIHSEDIDMLKERFDALLLGEIKPDQKAIIASGFSKTTDVKRAQVLGAGKYIKKPNTIEKFGMAIKEELTR